MLQVQYSMFPASVHVASFASVLVRLCPSAATTVSSWLISVSPFSSLKIFPHVPQVQYAMFPASVQVAAFASVLLKSWPAATTVSSWLISCVPSLSLNSFPHVPQVQYAMFPASVQVAAFASVLLKSWPAATTVSDWLISCVPSLSLNSFLQIPQVQYSMFPASVHVASFASVFSRLWIVLSSLWLSSLLQVLIAKPSSSSVAGFTSVHSPQAWPVAATTVSFSLISVVPSASLNSFLQIPQVQYSMLPASVQVAAFSSVFDVARLGAGRGLLFCLA